MRLRPYQQHTVTSIRDQLRSNNSTLAVLATGLGKTVVFSHLAHQWPGRCLVLAHREELVQQAAQKITAITGSAPGIEMADARVDESGFYTPSRIVVGSVQTLCKPRRQERFRRDSFHLLIIDEAHHAVASSYRSVMEYFAPQGHPLKVLGVTATPQRSDQLAMGQVFQSVAYDYGIEPAVSDGWLVPVRQQAIKVEGLDFSHVRTTAGDLNEGDLNRILSEERHLHSIVAPTVEIAGDLPTLVFCVSVQHAHLVAELINRYKPRSAIALSGSTSKDDRRRWIAQFREGNVQFLCNCALFLEGFDAPTTSMIVMARPTKSLPLYTQVIGRGTRPLPGVIDSPHLQTGTPEERRAAILASSKPGMLVLDFVGNSGKHKIVQASDVLGGKYGEEVRQYARKTAEEEGGAAGIEERLDRADAEVSLISEEQERRRKIQARAQFTTNEVSPFDGKKASSSTPGILSGPWEGPERITAKQYGMLVGRFKWEPQAAARLTKKQASAIIGKLMNGGK